MPTLDLINAYEPNDVRKEATIIFIDNSGAHRGTILWDGFRVPSSDSVQGLYFNYKAYTSKLKEKYADPGDKNRPKNIRVLRYADVLLMNAEANAELGNTSDALASLEMVRARARSYAIANGAPANTLPQVTTNDKSALLKAIYHERRVELAMDFDSRYFDVIRQGRAATVFGPLGWQPNKNEVWPIPQKEIDNSFGTLTQNPGY
jgi:hypothetical protein